MQAINMEVLKRIFDLFGLFRFSSSASDEELRAALEGFDWYSQYLMKAVDPQWDPSTRIRNIEYCAFLYGATLAIVRGYGREDADSAGVLRRYLSRFVDWEFSVGWLLNCEAELSCSPRLQSVQAAGGNTAQAVLLASREQSDVLRHPQNLQLLMEIFSEVRKLMDDRATPGECLFAASNRLAIQW
ncbi:MAG TPA: hypothetical protein VNU68_32075 [Verrucomicrobiae bacterium]|nr:hypothetical protein [Verrucomicrobiae bacterium]